MYLSLKSGKSLSRCFPKSEYGRVIRNARTNSSSRFNSTNITKKYQKSIDYIQNLGFDSSESTKLIKSLEDMKQEASVCTLKVSFSKVF